MLRHFDAPHQGLRAPCTPGRVYCPFGNTFRDGPSCVQSRPFTRTMMSNAWSQRTWFSWNCK